MDRRLDRRLADSEGRRDELETREVITPGHLPWPITYIRVSNTINRSRNPRIARRRYSQEGTL